MESPFFEWESAGIQCGAGLPAMCGVTCTQANKNAKLTKSRQQKRATRMDSPFFEWEPGNVLLSHGETPNYHRR
jgi:hypothetical protein